MNRKLLKLIATTRNTEGLKQLLEKAPVFLVGGCVRDIFLDKVSKDIDLVVENLPLEEIKTLLAPFGDVKIVGESFRVIKFKPFGFKGEPFDIAQPRKDIKVGKGHKGFKTVLVKSINEDLRRRDFTINSIAVSLKDAKIIDPFNGLKDLKRGFIRATDRRAFVEDPLRILRAIQFAARFDFDIERRTKQLMKDFALLIKEISGERILEELEKILSKSGNTQLAFDLIEETEVDFALFDRRLHEHRELPQLDRLSFFFMLAKLGDQNPRQFFMDRLKGDKPTGKDLDNLDHILSLPENISERDLRFELFKAKKKTSLIDSCIILPFRFEKVFAMMRNERIPLSQDDLGFNGNDIKDLIGEGPQVGKVSAEVTKSALMDEFDWRDRETCLTVINRIVQ